MNHLSRDELLDAVEGGGGRREHLESCAGCRQEVEALAGVLNDVAATDVPEPSPLFWEHFSARVSEAVRLEPPAPGLPRSGALWRAAADRLRHARMLPGWRLAVPAVGVLAIVAVLVVRLDRPDLPEPMASREPATSPAPLQPVSADQAGTPADEESWLVFSALATEADPAGSAFSSLAPGVAEGAVLEMTDEERGELVRLLKVELAQPRVRGRG